MRPHSALFDDVDLEEPGAGGDEFDDEFDLDRADDDDEEDLDDEFDLEDEEVDGVTEEDQCVPSLSPCFPSEADPCFVGTTRSLTKVSRRSEPHAPPPTTRRTPKTPKTTRPSPPVSTPPAPTPSLSQAKSTRRWKSLKLHVPTTKGRRTAMMRMAV